MCSGYRSSKEVLLGNEKSSVDGLDVEPFFKGSTRNKQAAKQKQKQNTLACSKKFFLRYAFIWKYHIPSYFSIPDNKGWKKRWNKT